MLTLDNLIRKGYLPSELPPPYTTESLANNLTTITNQINVYRPNKSKCCNYSITRIKHLRRLLGIPNPLQEIRLCQALVDNWTEISNFYSRSMLSLSRPMVISNSERALTRSHKYGQIFEEGVLRSTSSRYLLRTDISRYYPTLYTHSIPWALHTKALAKVSRGDSLYGNIIDRCVRNTQDEQTIGIPVGPDSSFAISEMISTAIDERLMQMFNNLNGIRYMDDYFLFLGSYSEAEQVLAAFLAILKDFELELNPSKTFILEQPEILDQSWAAELRLFSFRQTDSRQRNDILDYFNKAFELVRKYPNAYILKYALTRIKSQRVIQDNWSLYEAFLLKSIITEPNVLPIVSQIFLTYSTMGYTFDNTKIKNVITEMVCHHAQFKHGFEISWSMWLSRMLGISLADRAVAAISSLDDSVIALIALQMRADGLVDGALDLALWRSLMVAGSLYNEYWLLAYEAKHKGWLSSVSGRNYLASDDFFSILFNLDVSFFDETKQVDLVRLSGASHQVIAESVYEEDDQDDIVNEVENEWIDGYY